jgi:putative ABC transport system permease protein
MMHDLRFALRSLRRQWYAGELRLLLLALAVAVGSVTAVGFFTDRIQGLMQDQAGELLAADLVVAGSRPVPQAWREQAERLELRQARTVTFPSVVVAGETLQLAEVKAVSAGYPLRGRLRLRDSLFGPERPAQGIPETGEAWLDPRLAGLLQRSPGESLQLGRLKLKLGAILAYEPDRGGDFFSIAPRLMFSLDDLPASGLIQPGSRVSYHLLLAGGREAIARFRAAVGPAAREQGFRLLTAEDARPELRVAMGRARNFLGLATIVTTILAGVAIAAAARRYAVRNQDVTAILRCYGATRADIRRHFLWQLSLLGLIGSALGIGLGYAAHYPVLYQLRELIQLDALPAASGAPLFTGLLTGLLAMLGFALPPLLALGRVPPLRVLRKDLGAPRPSFWSLALLAVAAVAAILWWQVGDWQVVAILLGGIALALLLLAALAWLMLRTLVPLRRHFPMAMRFGIANLARRRGDTIAQILAFGLAIMVILLLTVVRNELLDNWRAQLPADAPNHFLINIQAGEIPAMRHFLAGHGVELGQVYPTVRGRLLAINGEPVTAEHYRDARAQRLATREFNLSWTDSLPADNTLVAGEFWAPGPADPAQISLEEGLARTLGLKLGDRLRFAVAGQEFEVRISSLRKVEWDSFQVNFFALLPPQQLQGMPTSWITSFYLPVDKQPLLNQLVRQYPNITVIDIATIMQQVRSIMDKVSLAIQYVFLFTLLAGLVLLYTAIQTTQDVRMKEGAILRTLGATSAELRLSQLAEFAAIGLLASLLGVVTTHAIAAVLGHVVLELDYRPSWLWSISGLVFGTAGITLAGLLGTRRLILLPSWQIIRE